MEKKQNASVYILYDQTNAIPTIIYLPVQAQGRRTITAQALRKMKKATSSLREGEAVVHFKDVSGTSLCTVNETSNDQVFLDHSLYGNSLANMALTPTTINSNDLDTINDNYEVDEVVDLGKASYIVVSPLNEKGVNDLDKGPRPRDLHRNLFMGRPLFGDPSAFKGHAIPLYDSTPK
ncbi:hypothetical protein ACH5RR_040878 [Cinchona calisaya]|uniref:Uncharacterized protein n=1 Tax=Cinchona calisaya TaxID=153742 RepID=A0ABD2XUJ0_9GENT